MKLSSKITCISARWFIPAWLMLFTFVCSLAMSRGTLSTNLANPETTIESSVTYSTEVLSAGGAYQNTSDHLLYILKINTGSEVVTFDNLSIQTTGTYTSADIGRFRLWRNTIPVMDGRRVWGPDGPVTGNGETLSFSVSHTLEANTTTYFLVSADVKLQAVGGHTFGINGASNALEINYSIDPVVINNQDNLAGLQTITAPRVLYATLPLGEREVLRGTENHVLYVFQVSTGSNPVLNFTNLTIRTTGTYSAADISTFRLFRSTTSLMTAESVEASTIGSAVKGNGELISFSGLQTLQPNTTTYFGIVADIPTNATAGRTFGIDGLNNDLNITWSPYSHVPSIIDNQTNDAGMQTIFAHTLTSTTEPLLAENVLQAEIDRLVYVLKVVVGGAGVTSNVVNIKTTGTYAGSDITSFILVRSRSRDMSRPAVEGASFFISASGNGEVLSFNMPQTLAKNTTYYFGLLAAVSPDATTGNTFGVDGSANAVNMNFSSGFTVIDYIDNQTNVAGLKTIGVSGVTYTTESLPAGNVLPGVVDLSVYTLKVVMNGNAGATLTDLSVTTDGTYGAGDITSFNLYQSDTPVINEGGLSGRVFGSPIATINSPTGAGETLTFNTGGTSLPAGRATYLIIKANVASSGTSQRTFHINGESNPASLYFSGASPSPITNNQSNSAGEQTIGSVLPVTLVSFKAKAEGNVRQLWWETSMEKDNDYFEIQRSFDAKNFSAIGHLQGAASGVQTNDYYFTDSDPVTAAGVVFYRLKMADLDGSFSFSRIQSVQITQSSNVTIFPNPVSEGITLYTKDWEDVKAVKIFNLTGTTLYNSAITGLNKSIDVKWMEEGMYVVELSFKDGQTQTSRIVITR